MTSLAEGRSVISLVSRGLPWNGTGSNDKGLIWLDAHGETMKMPLLVLRHLCHHRDRHVGWAVGVECGVSGAVSSPAIIACSITLEMTLLCTGRMAEWSKALHSRKIISSQSKSVVLQFRKERGFESHFCHIFFFCARPALFKNPRTHMTKNGTLGSGTRIPAGFDPGSAPSRVTWVGWGKREDGGTPLRQLRIGRIGR